MCQYEHVYKYTMYDILTFGIFSSPCQTLLIFIYIVGIIQSVCGFEGDNSVHFREHGSRKTIFRKEVQGRQVS